MKKPKFTFDLNERENVETLSEAELDERIEAIDEVINDTRTKNPSDEILPFLEKGLKYYLKEKMRRLDEKFGVLNDSIDLDDIHVSFNYDELLFELKADVDEGLISMDEDIKIVWDEIEGYRYICDYYYIDCKCKEPHEIKKVKDVISFMEDESSIIKPKLIKNIHN